MNPVRISNLPRAGVCPASWVTAGESGHPDVRSDASRMGDAFHFAMELRGLGREVPLIEVAREYGVPLVDLSDLVANSTFSPCREGAEFEVVLELDAGVTRLVGHADWLWIDHENRTIHLFDYKTTARPEGAAPPLEDAQMMGYAVAVAQRHRDLVQRGYTVTVTKHYPRAPREPADGEMGQYEVAVMDEAMLRSAESWVCGIVAAAREQYAKPVAERTYRINEFSTATSCNYCAGAIACPALKTKLRGIVEWRGGAPLTDEEWVATFRLLEGFGVVDKARDAFRRSLVVKIDVSGPLSLDETHEVRVVERKMGERKVIRFPMVTRKEKT